MNLTPWVRTGTPGGEPGWPDLRPVIEIWRDATPPVKLLNKDMASYLPGVVEGLFRYSEFLGPLYNTPGRHFVFIRWTDQDGNPRLVAGSFELTGGGNQAGTIISMTEVARPDARYLLTATDAGTISRRKNPR
jgi:hypothetical protein